MTTAVQRFLQAFDSLSEANQHQVAVEILRRWMPDGDLPESAFAEIAGDLLRALDDEEARKVSR